MNALTIITPETRAANLAKFDHLAAQIKTHIDQVKTITVKDEDSKNTAYSVGKSISDYEKNVDTVLKSITKPLKDYCKEVEAYAKKLTVPLEEGKTHVKMQLADFERELEKIRQAELKKAQEEHERKMKEAAAKAAAEAEEAAIAAAFMDEPDAKQAQAVAQVQAERLVAEVESEHRANVTSIASQKVRGSSKVWTFDIEDDAKIPREFMVVDEKKIREAVKNGAREIPGVRIYEDVRVSFR